MSGIKLGLINDDVRGKIYRFMFRERSFELIECVKGAVRGGHFHKTNSTIVMLYGSLLYRQINPSIGASSEKHLTLRAGDTIRIEAGIAHLVTANEDSLLMEWLEGEYESTNYPEWRRLVEDFINKQSG